MNKPEHQKYPDGSRVRFTDGAIEAGQKRPGGRELKEPANGFDATYTIRNTDDSQHDVILEETGERYGTYWLRKVVSFGDEDILATIRKRDEERRSIEESGIIGGMRESFEISSLLQIIDRRDAVLAQVHQLTEQAVGSSFQAVNAYRLRAALDGEAVIGN